ncbi:hypothetical protein ZIOFF_001126 [Zingiber officinale]|uniref:Methyltransferase family protein n=1 Tax=Zingiber officinale TaxID=94328 RepID=A0A8J5I5H0_ZINOF|nr:hypothetical protein ZIOFF_001126 [Zingiber officinale]
MLRFRVIEDDDDEDIELRGILLGKLERAGSAAMSAAHCSPSRDGSASARARKSGFSSNVRGILSSFTLMVPPLRDLTDRDAVFSVSLIAPPLCDSVSLAAGEPDVDMLKRQLCWSAAATDSSRVCHAICAMEESDDDTICLGDSIFVNRDYELTTFTFGRHSLRLLCLRSASTDYDLTGQVVWPGAVLLNNYLTENAGMLHGCSIIELGSGIGITGILCSRFCREIVLTDHNVEVLEARSKLVLLVHFVIIRKNIELQSSLDDPCSAGKGAKLFNRLSALKLEWGNSDQLSKILQEHPAGFDLVLGADIYIFYISGLFFILIVPYSEVMFLSLTLSKASNSPASLLFSILMDAMIVDEALKHGMQISEVQGTRSVVANLEGVIFEITMQSS